jgi:pyruvate,orthophosphate dikinase
VPGARLPAGGAAAVGGKAWHLMELARAGLPVPAAFVLPTSWCRAGLGGAADDAAVRQALATGITRLEAITGLGFGSVRRPLLVSVRSGGAVSMPGMLETVLDVGLTPTSVEGLMRLTGNPRLAWDSYRRLVQGFAEVVAGLPTAPFDALVRDTVAVEQVDGERELDHRALRSLTLGMLDRFATLAGAPFPDDPMEQLAQAAAAVFRSWDAPKAATYRRMNGVDDAAGTAVTVQTMVFGNAGGASGAGVGFTRDPASGARTLYYDFCFNGQGEDVVAGRRTSTDPDRLRRALPSVFDELQAVAGRLEAQFHDAQDFEFTVQEGRLYLLQTRPAKRTPWAALRIAVDMVEEGLITPGAALARLDAIDAGAVVRTRFVAPEAAPLGTATVASPGAASGPIAFTSAMAERLAAGGTPAILVRPATETGDIAGMAPAAGILTASGSRTSHAAVVARQLGKVCLVGCGALVMDLARPSCRIGEVVLEEGEVISLDGNSGAIYRGAIEVVRERPERELAIVAGWRREVEPGRAA